VRGAERGVALLSALFAVALLTVIVVEMTDATLVHTHLNRNAGNAMAAQLLARSAAIAGEAMVRDKNANPASITCPQNLWAMPLFGVPAGSGVVGLQVTDEGGKLDLNGARDTRYRAALEALFSSLDLDPSLVGRIAAWIGNPDDPAMATGPASDYCALAMPCAPRQQPLKSLDELLLIRGFDEERVARLRPYATVVPRPEGRAAGSPQPVNALTARPQVLQALGCEGSATPPECAMRFDDEEDDKTKEWRTEFEQWRTTSCAAAGNLITTKSTVFSLLASGSVGDVSQTLRVVLRRDGDKVTRLWWQERPLAEAMPVEIR
jgi:general secretion pathway protein K